MTRSKRMGSTLTLQPLGNGRWRLAEPEFQRPVPRPCLVRTVDAVPSVLLPHPVCLYLLRKYLHSSFSNQMISSDIFIAMLAYCQVAMNASMSREAWHQPRCLPCTSTLGILRRDGMKRKYIFDMSHPRHAIELSTVRQEDFHPAPRKAIEQFDISKNASRKKGERRKENQ
jgi:hypothetical protein